MVSRQRISRSRSSADDDSITSIKVGGGGGIADFVEAPPDATAPDELEGPFLPAAIESCSLLFTVDCLDAVSFFIVDVDSLRVTPTPDVIDPSSPVPRGVTLGDAVAEEVVCCCCC